MVSVWGGRVGGDAKHGGHIGDFVRQFQSLLTSIQGKCLVEYLDI